ncbi:hypothetical protein BDV27DRAFT_153522 [Aspergillus caelatus]|uniref:Amino acid permease/ SLC12A domain-containing protein n=1 Tax=Aspergillus caelatus TaxID=61420 RepID=A0A5N7AI77_9EURO|nr:uncharacterized protein BDV27DRAFT_153522 [Aspergillus caelatus]KAE8368888.1 hypothetical protein BDV27DRAFT_153522 [Aspergillus caelatus]
MGTKEAPTSDGIEDVSYGMHYYDAHDIQKPVDVVTGTDQMQRRLENRQIKIMGVGGAIGTALFISIGGSQISSPPSVDRKAFPYFGRFQPYSAWIGLIGECLIVIFYGYSSFIPWDVSNLFTHYTMLILAPILYFSWKIFWRTRVVKPGEADLIWERPMIDTYEAGLTSPPRGFWAEILLTVGWRRGPKNQEASNGC